MPPEGIISDPLAFVDAVETGAFPADGPVFPKAVMMVEPNTFRVAPETASDNRYLDLDSTADPERALAQSRALAATLQAHGVDVVTFPGDPEATDGVFPNNVFATVPGRLIVGHMRHAGRRREAERADIRAWFRQRGYTLTDLSKAPCYAELTGVLVLDRLRRIGFCGMSTRVDEAGLEAMHRAFDLRLTLRFDLAAHEYHTNVVLAVLAGRACVLFPESFADPAAPAAIARAFPGRTLLLDESEKNAFAGNCIALTGQHVFMSRTAADALRRSSRRTLADWGFEIVSVELDEIEKAGGSLRCMLAEIF
jgi:hypothetical protein